MLLSGDERPRVFIARAVPDPGVDLIREVAEVDLWTEYLPPPREELLRRIAGCAGVLLLPSERVDDAFIDAAGGTLRAVSSFSVGYEHFDVNLVEVYISGLRKKLEEHGARIVHTIRNVGYVLRPDPDGAFSHA